MNSQYEMDTMYSVKISKGVIALSFYNTSKLMKLFKKSMFNEECKGAQPVHMEQHH